jgi:hypothetical protein
MNFVSIELPALRIALPRKAIEFFNASLRIVTAREFLKIISDELVQALP